MKRVLSGLYSGGLDGVAKEFGVDSSTAREYTNMLPGGTYGEEDIELKELHQLKAPQCILKLLRYFKIDDTVITKLLQLYKTSKGHRGSPDDPVCLQQLIDGERLVASIEKPNDLFLQQHGLTASKTQFAGGGWYVYRPEDQDVVDQFLRFDVVSDELELDLMQGLAYGYKIVDVMNFVRKRDPELVDSVCGTG